MSKKKIVWFAKAGEIARCGPFESQLKAFNAMRLAHDSSARSAGSFHMLNGFPFPSDIVVWPEEKDL